MMANIEIKIFQTSFGAKEGNCMQAVIATLYGLKLSDVPNFISFGTAWHREYFNFLKSIGYEYSGCLINVRQLGAWGEDRFNSIKETNGVNGLFDASVFSPKHFNQKDYIKTGTSVRHAVIIDKDFNIIHDPNPDYQGIKEYPLSNIIGYNGITEIYLTGKING